MSLLFPLTAAAQPFQGQVAAGGEVGVFFPADDRFDSALIGGGFLEIYPHARFGVRPGFYITQPEYTFSPNRHERQMRLAMDFIYNWEGGRIHPFIGGGLGAHFIRHRDHGENIGDSSARLGVAVLTGLEYFLNRAWAVKPELRYHWVDNVRGIDPDGLALTVGLKRYF